MAKTDKQVESLKIPPHSIEAEQSVLGGLMLDNEASKEEEVYVQDHIEQCMVCFEHYEVEKQIRELIRKKIANMPVPEGLAHQIRTKIQFIQ